MFCKRITFVGDPYTNNPDIYELPYHNLKINISKTFAKKFMIDFQINNILGGSKEFIQIEKSNNGEDVILITEKSNIPRIYSFKFTLKNIISSKNIGIKFLYSFHNLITFVLSEKKPRVDFR